MSVDSGPLVLGLVLGVDTGGTFTDFVLLTPDGLRIHKQLSTPDAPERAILEGVSHLLDERSGLHVVHGSTVATNAVLEGKEARTAYITNRGLTDVLTIGRQARADLYDLQPPARRPPVPAPLCFGTGGRLDAQGNSLEDLGEDELIELGRALQASAPDAVAINLLFSFLNPDGEERIARHLRARLGERVFICRSSEVLAEAREYERGMATWLNASTGPLLQGYLERLTRGLRPASVSVMRSSGDTMDGTEAGRHGVHMLLSGPAGGLRGALHLGRSAGHERLLTFDMGGTSTDVALLDGGINLTNEGHIGAYPVAVPQVDMHTIGAGGGSLASVDAGGMLQVGPESAGADPGPACYGKGGARPTVTDANLVLGRLLPECFLGGHMSLDGDAARSAVGTVADALDMSIEEAARGIVRIANEHMAHALRVISVQRGLDPSAYTLMSFGGAGGLHVCALAEALGMKRAIIPVHAGVLSALGMIAAPRGRGLSQGFSGILDTLDRAGLEAAFQALEREGTGALRSEGVPEAELKTRRLADLRYLGQSYSLTLPWPENTHVHEIAEAFHKAHEARYGHRMDESCELVNIRVHARGPDPGLCLPRLPEGGPAGAAASQFTRVFGHDGDVPVYDRATLRGGDRMSGPALITETVSTSYIAPAWRVRVDHVGNLLLFQDEAA
ncbi:MAG: hydantoinase/oxoprolinase family protein [Gammaproteobacteria bacterium]